MVMNYMQPVTLISVIESLPTSVYVKGRMFLQTQRGSLAILAITTESFKHSQSYLRELKTGNPVIPHVQNYNGITGHAIVVVGIRDFDGEKARALVVTIRGLNHTKSMST